MEKNLIFFSYSRVDSDFALKLANDLRQSGVELWIDQLDIKGGSHWDASIEDALNASNKMIVILSASSVASNNVMDEVSYGLENNKKIIPVLLNDCKAPFRLRRLQHIDFTSDYEKGLNQLLETVKSTDNQNPIPIVTEVEPEIPLPEKEDEVIKPIITKDLKSIAVEKEIEREKEFKRLLESERQKERERERQKKEVQKRRNKIIIIASSALVVLVLLAIAIYNYQFKKPETVVNTVPVDTTKIVVPVVKDTIKKSDTINKPETDKMIIKQLNGLVSKDGIEYSYYGETVNNIPEGKGTGRFFNGKYTGQWKKGMTVGQGTFVYGNGTIYKGSLHYNVLNGFGTIKYKSGVEYVGNFKDNSYNGKGILILADGGKYEGEFKNSLFEGKGTMIFVKGDKYIGSWKNDKKDGFGTYIEKDGGKYEGEYKNDHQHGYGKYIFKNGDEYVGNLKDGLFEGDGTKKYANGDKYVGSWEKDVQNGFGTFTSKDSKYTGNFVNGEYEGKGTLILSENMQIKNCPNSSKYIGGWKKGLKEGFGQCFDDKNKLLYEGYFKDNKPVSKYPNR